MKKYYELSKPILFKNIDKELIKKELNEYDIKYKRLKLTNKFINNLKNKYTLVEMCENSYDSEPIENYLNCKLEYKTVTYEEYNELLKTIDGSLKLKKIYQDYEKHRISFCNWQEPTFKGNWGQSQQNVNIYGIRKLKYIKRSGYSLKDRLYVGYEEDYVYIYVYFRDVLYEDIWFVYRKNR